MTPAPTVSRRPVRTSATAAAAPCSTGRRPLIWPGRPIRSARGWGASGSRPRSCRPSPPRRTPGAGSPCTHAPSARGWRSATAGAGGPGGWSRSRDVCPIAHPALEAALPALAVLAKPFLEHPRSAPTLHVTWTETGLDVDVTGVERRSGGLSADARVAAAERAAAGDFARVTLAGEIVYRGAPALRWCGWAARRSSPCRPAASCRPCPRAEAAMAAFAVRAVDGASRRSPTSLLAASGPSASASPRIASVHRRRRLSRAASIKALIGRLGLGDRA